MTKKTKQLVAGFCWVFSIGIGLAIIYGVYPYSDQSVVDQLDPISVKAFDMSYGPLHRFAWSIAVAWVILACICGYGGMSPSISSDPPFLAHVFFVLKLRQV